MVERYVSKVTLTDYVGPYTAYTYADGHVETDPPNRPKSREDVQRERRGQVAAQSRAQRQLEAERSTEGLPSTAVARDLSLATASRSLTEPFHAAIEALTDAAETIATPPEQLAALVGSFDLGGTIGDSPKEYGPQTPKRDDGTGRGVREAVYPVEGR